MASRYSKKLLLRGGYQAANSAGFSMVANLTCRGKSAAAAALRTGWILLSYRGGNIKIIHNVLIDILHDIGVLFSTYIVGQYGYAKLT